MFLLYALTGKCDHPFKMLAVQKDSTVEPSGKYPNDFNHVTHHLFCQRCSEKLDLGYAQMIGGADAFISRKSDEIAKEEK